MRKISGARKVWKRSFFFFFSCISCRLFIIPTRSITMGSASSRRKSRPTGAERPTVVSSAPEATSVVALRRAKSFRMDLSLVSKWNKVCVFGEIKSFKSLYHILVEPKGMAMRQWKEYQRVQKDKRTGDVEIILDDSRRRHGPGEEKDDDDDDDDDDDEKEDEDEDEDEDDADDNEDAINSAGVGIVPSMRKVAANHIQRKKRFLRVANKEKILLNPFCWMCMRLFEEKAWVRKQKEKRSVWMSQEESDRDLQRIITEIESAWGALWDAFSRLSADFVESCWTQKDPILGWSPFGMSIVLDLGILLKRMMDHALFSLPSMGAYGQWGMNPFLGRWEAVCMEGFMDQKEWKDETKKTFLEFLQSQNLSTLHLMVFPRMSPTFDIYMGELATSSSPRLIEEKKKPTKLKETNYVSLVTENDDMILHVRRMLDLLLRIYDSKEHDSDESSSPFVGWLSICILLDRTKTWKEVLSSPDLIPKRWLRSMWTPYGVLKHPAMMICSAWKKKWAEPPKENLKVILSIETEQREIRRRSSQSEDTITTTTKGGEGEEEKEEEEKEAKKSSAGSDQQSPLVSVYPSNRTAYAANGWCPIHEACASLYPSVLVSLLDSGSFNLKNSSDLLQGPDSFLSLVFRSIESPSPKRRDEVQLVMMHVIRKRLEENLSSRHLCLADSSTVALAILMGVRLDDERSRMINTRVGQWEFDPNAKDSITLSKRDPPLLWACRFGRYEVAELLATMHANLDALSEIDGLNAISILCKPNTKQSREDKNKEQRQLAFDTIARLVRYGADPAQKLSSNHGMNFIMVAAQNSIVEALSLLDEALYATTDDEGRCFLHHAIVAEGGDLEHLHFLRAALEDDKVLPLINVQDSNGRTPLMEAVARGHEECVSLLMRHAEVIDATLFDSFGHSLLHIAVQTDRASLVRLLGTSFPQIINSQSKDSMGQTALHLALRKNACKETIRTLMGLGASRRIKDASNMLPLQICSPEQNTWLLQSPSH
eukprot:TRINITY_DN151_c0_g1_i1.p1 TRINITY_DN151_c0_g1~~TRINITY_DN151_c0_g1_i1.p1  ORF type:complete len:996 (+),score=279.64 TRINITY_DN151_c0_g1_i1:60-3047(+)